MKREKKRKRVRGAPESQKTKPEPGASQPVRPSKLKATDNFARQVLGTMGQGLVVTDAGGRIQYVNPAFAQHVQGLPSDLIGKPVLDLFWTEDHSLVQCVLEQKELGESNMHNVRMKTRDADPILVLINSVPRRRGEQIIGNIIVVTDLTARSHAEESLRKSEQYVRGIIDSSLDMIITVDNERRIVEFNRAAQASFGYTRDEVIGKHINILYANLEQSQATHQAAISNETFIGEVANRRKNGEVFYSRVSTSPIRDAQGNPIGIVGVSRDVTESRRIEEALKKSEAQNRFVVENLGEGIAFADLDERIIFANPAAESIFGTPGALVGRTLREFTTPEQFALIQAQTQRRARGEKNSYELEISRLNGEKRALIVTAAPWYDREGNFMGAFGVFRDISERKRVELAEREQRTLAEALRDTAAALNSTLEFEQVLDQILKNVGRVVPHDAANIMLVSDGISSVARSHGYDAYGLEAMVSRVRFHVEEVRYFREMMLDRQAVVIPDSREYPDWVTSPISSWVVSYVGTPIRIKDQVVGFLNLDSKTPDFFKIEHAERLRAFADQAALAIENARLYQQVQQMAITDSLTGLYNRRGLMQLGKREVSRALRNNTPLTLILFDLDHFKQVNDTFGHHAGDKILVAIAERCQSLVRAPDILARYGGEEFVLLLPETNLKVASNVAERLRQVVAAISTMINGVEIRVTISLGVAETGPRVTNLDQLIDCADKLQYRAKQAGRNRVEM